MSILNRIKYSFYKNWSFVITLDHIEYYIILIINMVIYVITCFCFDNYKKDILLKNANQYNIMINSHYNACKFVEFQNNGNIYGDLTKLYLAALYLKKQDFYKAEHYYYVILRSKKSIEIYRNYSRSILLKIKALINN